MKGENVNLILDKKLCSGCGACSAVCRKNSIRMLKGGSYNYPRIDCESCNNCGLCLKVCPGSRILDRLASGSLLPLKVQGTLANYVASSKDDEIRYNAASGGVVSSLLSFLLRKGHIDGAICARQDDVDPLANRSFIARTEAEVLQASGSRYSPVSGCEVLKEIFNDNKLYAFVGKPCEIDAVNQMQKYLPELKKRIQLKISIMCACTPSRKGTLELLQALRIHPSEVRKLSYRGKGWPGSFSVETRDGSQLSIPYLDAWNNCLSKHSCLRCTVCDDPLGSGADITVGDAWDRKLLINNSGLSAVVVRTEAGRRYMDMAINDNVLAAERISADDICRFQKSLVSKTRKAAANTFAFNLVFLHRLDIEGIRKESGHDLKKYLSLFRRVFRFFAYKSSNHYR